MLVKQSSAYLKKLSSESYYDISMIILFHFILSVTDKFLRMCTQLSRLLLMVHFQLTLLQMEVESTSFHFALPQM